MRRLILFAAALSLAACSTTRSAFDCTTAQHRRELYQRGADVADAAIRSGDNVQAALVARGVAEAALAAVNARCPMDADGEH